MLFLKGLKGTTKYIAVLLAHTMASITITNTCETISREKMPKNIRTQAARIKMKVLKGKKKKTSLRGTNNFFHTVHGKENRLSPVLKDAHGALSIWQHIFLSYT